MMRTAVLMCGNIITCIAIIYVISCFCCDATWGWPTVGHGWPIHPGLWVRLRWFGSARIRPLWWVSSRIPILRRSGGWGRLDAHCSTKTRCGARLYTSIPFTILQGQQRKTAMTVDSMDWGNTRQSSGVINVLGKGDYTCDFIMMWCFLHVMKSEHGGKSWVNNLMKSSPDVWVLRSHRLQ